MNKLITEKIEEFRKVCDEQSFGISFECDVQEYERSVKSLEAFLEESLHSLLEDYKQELLGEVKEIQYSIRTESNYAEILRQKVIDLLTMKR